MPNPSYVNFMPDGHSKSGKTRLWRVMSGPSQLGMIEWFAAWRKYCFFPGYPIIFDQACLREIADFIELCTAQHKAKLEEGAGFEPASPLRGIRVSNTAR